MVEIKSRISKVLSHPVKVGVTILNTPTRIGEITVLNDKGSSFSIRADVYDITEDNERGFLKFLVGNRPPHVQNLSLIEGLPAGFFVLDSWSTKKFSDIDLFAALILTTEDGSEIAIQPSEMLYNLTVTYNSTQLSSQPEFDLDDIP